MPDNQVHIDVGVQQAIELFDGLLGKHDSSQSVQQFLEALSQRLLFGHETRNSGIKFIVSQKFKIYDLDEIYSSEFTLNDAKFCIAKEHGYDNWQDVERLESSVDYAFESLIDAMLAGDINRLKRSIDGNPDIVHQKSHYPHQATLLHYTGSNGVEGYRQVVPLNLAEIVELLLEAGSDRTLAANVYGGCIAQELLQTSKHPYDAGVINEVLAVYDKYG